MFSIARSAALFALLAAVAPALAQVSGADVAISDPDMTMCPLPTPGANVNANVLAVVHFDETVSANVAGVLTAGVPVTVDVCLCLSAAAATGPVTLPASLEPNVDSATSAFIQTNPNDSAAITLLKTDLLTNGALLNVAVAPSNNIDPCACAPTDIPGCTDGGCTCTPCAVPGTFYSPTRGICVLPPSAAAGGAARMARARRADAGLVAARQAKRSDIEARMA